MCGIAGFIGRGNLDTVKIMSNKLIHRGPDEEGFYCDQSQSLFFTHRRLSIIDLSGGKQPMENSSETIIVTFNGEIYNFLELKQQLIECGYKFKTNSDTEVLIHGYDKWGVNLPKFLNGMFAFAIYDKHNKKVFFARDRFGEKPFYYFFDEKNFAFASELKSLIQYPLITPKLSNISIQKYFAYGYIPAPLTIYKNCYKLKPGDYAVFDLQDHKLQLNSYWKFAIKPDYGIKNEDQVIEELDELLTKSVKSRLISDVPLGLFLSGGIDSSAVLAYTCDLIDKKAINTFTIGFNENSFDESSYAKEIANFFGVKNSQKILDLETMKNLCPKILEKLDEPIGDASILPTYFLSEFAKKHITVALSGDGGDEMFAGYDPFNALKVANFYDKIIPKFLHNKITKIADLLPISQKNMSLDFKIKRTLLGLSYDKPFWNPIWLSSTSPEQIKDLFLHPLKTEELYSEVLDVWNQGKNLDLIDKTMEFYTNFYLPGSVLAKVDRSTMMNSLESRAIFLDKDIADFCMRLPNSFKFKNGIKKYILKKLLSRKLPKHIVDRKKKGFGVPTGQWLMNFPKQIPLQNIPDINMDFAKQLWNEHRNSKKNNRLFMWNWFVLQKFLIKK